MFLGRSVRGTHQTSCMNGFSAVPGFVVLMVCSMSGGSGIALCSNRKIYSDHKSTG